MTTATTHPTPPHVRIIAVTADHLALTGDGNAAIFLAQVLFWWRVVGRKPFYKFNSPCEHDRYRAGDSWTEELCLKRTMLVTARRRVAVKVQYIHKPETVQAAFDAGALVVYGTDLTRTTYYHVNEALLQIEAPALYARLCTPDAAHTPSRTPPAHATHSAVPHSTTSATQSIPATTSTTPAATVVAPPPAVIPSTPHAIPTSVPTAASRHSVMQEPCISNSSEIASQMTTEALADELAPPPTHAATVLAGEGEEVTQIQWREIVVIVTDGLQQRGVQDNPARLIAWRAVRNGMGAADALNTFDAHVLDAERAGAKSAVGVAVSRMLQTSRITPAPAWALTEVARRNRQRAWEERQTERVASTDGQEVSGVDENVEVAELSEVDRPDATTTLWQQVLGDIKLQVTRATFTQRFQGTWLEQRGDAYVVCARDAATVEWLQHRLHRMIGVALKRWGGVDIAPRFACG